MCLISSLNVERAHNRCHSLCTFFHVVYFSLTNLPLLYTRLGNPILNLNYLLETIMQKVRPLDWSVFWEKQVTNKLPLKVTPMFI